MSSADAAAEAGHDAGHYDVNPVPQGIQSVYAGPVTGARIANWDATNPRPVIALAVRNTAQIQTLTMVQIQMDGTIGAIAADDLYVWSWPLAIDAPHVLYDGDLASGRLADWDASQRRPLVVMAHIGGSETWVASMLEIRPDGSFGTINADRVIVYGWNDGAVGSPTVRYDGTFDTATRIASWDATSIRPRIAMVGRSGSRIVSMLEIRADGSLGQLAAESLAMWEF